MRSGTIATVLFTFLLIRVAFAGATGAGVVPTSRDAKPAPVSPQLKGVTLQAPHLQVEQQDAAQKVTVMRGSGGAHLHLAYQDESQNVDLYADTVLVNFEQRFLEAHNKVRLQQKDKKGQLQELTGTTLRYGFDSQQGTLDNAQIVVEQLTFRGSQIQVQLKENRIGVASALITVSNCQKQDNPHFSLRAKQVEVTLEEEATARGVGFYFGKHKLFSFPSYTFALTPSKEPKRKRSFLPTFSFNSNDGLLLRSGYTIPLSKSKTQPRRGLFANVDLGYSQKRGVRGGPSLVYQSSFAAPTTPGEKANFSLALKERIRDGVEDHFNSRLLVDRRPELELKVQPFAIVPKRLAFDVEAATGKYHEFPTGVSSSRQNVTFNLDTRASGATSPLYGRLFAEKRWYSDSDMRVLGLEVGVQGRFARRAKGQISYVTTDIKGFTPFEFDQILIPQELRATVDVRLDRNWMLPLDLRYDLDQNLFRDKRIGLIRTLDCIGYGLSYDTARREIKLEFRLLGKDGF